MPLRTIPVDEPSSVKRQVWFDLRLESDGISPALGEGGGQPQISVAGLPWTDVGIGPLVEVGNGRYYAVLAPSTVSVFNTYIETRYKGTLTAETPGDSVSVAEFSLADIQATQEQILDTINGELVASGIAGELSATYYGNIIEANAYFDTKLYSTAWQRASVADRPKALLAATLVIDTLNFKGYKHTVFELLDASPSGNR
jgi:hypothetical protein